MRPAHFAAAFALFVALFGSTARAQGNFRSSPTGGRSELMGGTGIALARDGSAPNLNPATIIGIDDSGLAFSVNFYSLSSSRFGSFHQPGAVDPTHFGDLSLPATSVTQSRFDALPSSLCVFIALSPSIPEKSSAALKGRQRLAFCGGTMEEQQLSIAAAQYHGSSAGLTASSAASLARSWSRFYAGPSYSIFVSDRVAVGMSIQALETSYSSGTSTTAFTTDAANHAITSTYDLAAQAYSLDVAANVGLVYKPDRIYTLGLSISAPVGHISSNYDTSFATSYGGAGTYSRLQSGNGGDFYAPAPLRAGAGLGAEYGRIRLEVDATYYFPQGSARRATVPITDQQVLNGNVTTSSSTLDVSERDDAVVDGAFGIEYFTSQSLSVLGGINADFSAVPLLSRSPTETPIAQSRLERVAASLGLGSYGAGSQLLFGAEVSYAWGSAYAVDSYLLPNTLALVDQSAVAVMLVVAGSTSLSTLRATVNELGHTFKLRN